MQEVQDGNNDILKIDFNKKKYAEQYVNIHNNSSRSVDVNMKIIINTTAT